MRGWQPTSNRQAGVTVIELLVAGAVTVAILGLGAVFLGQQVQLQRNVQTRNDVQDRVRVATQLVTQDLALAGNRVLLQGDDGSTTDVTFGCFDPDDNSTSCLTVVDTSPTSSALELRYLSSQFSTSNACRDVAYRMNGATLQRSDVTCPADGTIADPVWRDLASDILGFKVIVICSDAARTRYATFPNAGCSGGTAYGRSAIFSVGAQSEGQAQSSAAQEDVELVTTTEHTMETVQCPDGRACFDMTQETLMPNLKDQ